MRLPFLSETEGACLSRYHSRLDCLSAIPLICPVTGAASAPGRVRHLPVRPRTYRPFSGTLRIPTAPHPGAYSVYGSVLFLFGGFCGLSDSLNSFRNGLGSFAYSLDGMKYKSCGEEFQMREGKRIGAKFGFVSVETDPKADRGWVDADWIRITP